MSGRQGTAATASMHWDTGTVFCKLVLNPFRDYPPTGMPNGNKRKKL